MHSLLRDNRGDGDFGAQEAPLESADENIFQKKVDKNFAGNKKGCTFAKFSACKKASKTKTNIEMIAIDKVVQEHKLKSIL